MTTNIRCPSAIILLLAKERHSGAAARSIAYTESKRSYKAEYVNTLYLVLVAHPNYAADQNG